MASGGAVPPVAIEKCGSCGTAVKENDKALTCDLCNVWVHTKCGGGCGVPDKLYKVIKELGVDCATVGIRWFCNKCNPQIDSLKLELKTIKDRHINLEKKHENLEVVVQKVQEDYASIKRTMDELTRTMNQNVSENQGKVDEDIVVLKDEITELKKSYSDMARGNAVDGARAISLQNSPSISVQVEVSEAMEREKRKNNLVIFGIEETNDEGMTRDKVKNILQAVEIDENKVKYFGRVGRNTSENKIRVVRVVCDDSETRRNFLKGANKLKTMQGYNKVYVSPDLTKAQQLLDKKLRDKLREIRVNTKEAKINNGEIVVFENNCKRVLYSQQN